MKLEDLEKAILLKKEFQDLDSFLAALTKNEAEGNHVKNVLLKFSFGDLVADFDDSIPVRSYNIDCITGILNSLRTRRVNCIKELMELGVEVIP